MKLQIQNWFFVFFVVLFQIGAQAEILQSVKIQGDGCPKGSVSTTLSPDSNEVSFIFDQFIHQNENSPISPKKWIMNMISIKKCQISIQVKVPEGYLLEDVQADLRGFVSKDQRVFHQQSLVLSQFLGKRQLASSIQTISTPSHVQEQDILLSNKLKTKKYSTCRERVETIVFEASSVFIGSLKKSQFLATVDSIDAKNSIALKVTPCAYDRR